MSNFYPSVTGLRSFEAAARHRSFTRAAIELNLTQSAVSHQIRKLEELLGVQLFDRIGNDVKLTDAGATYYDAARTMIIELRAATDRVMNLGEHDTLTIGTLGTFAVKCLSPILNEFVGQNPDLHVRLRIFPAATGPVGDDCDVSILYGRPSDWPNLIVNRLSRDQLFPVCSPILLQAASGPRNPADLAKCTIVRTTSPWIMRDDWPFWLRRAGVGNLIFEKEITCDLLYPSYQLAIDGLGVAMGRSTVVRRDVEAGLLVEPFSIRLDTPLGYHLVHQENRLATNKIDRFIDWITKAFSAEEGTSQEAESDV